MQGKKKTADALRERRRGLVPEKTSGYSYLIYYITLRDSMQAEKADGKAAFSGSYGIVTNRPPTGHTRRVLHEDNVQRKTVCLRRISRRLYIPGIFTDKQGRKAREEESLLSRSKETQSKTQGGETCPPPPCEFYPGRPRNPFDVRDTAGEPRGGGSIGTQFYSSSTESKETPRAPSAEIHSRYRERFEKRSLSSSRHVIGRNGQRRARKPMGFRLCKLPPSAIHRERPCGARTLHRQRPRRKKSMVRLEKSHRPRAENKGRAHIRQTSGRARKGHDQQCGV